jgi:hypothetical protein
MMKAKKRVLVLSLVTLAIGIGNARADIDKVVRQVSRPMLCVTEGRVEALSHDRLAVSTSKMRAVVIPPTTASIAARFTYLGETTPVSRLQSGELREQFGLKLRAENACNLVYVMWRIAPKPGLVVSVKSNPGLTRSRQCGNGGYRTVKPSLESPVPAPRPGETHSLSAALSGSILRVWTDGARGSTGDLAPPDDGARGASGGRLKLVWEGDLAPLALAPDSPVGMRSDNARLKLEIFATLVHAEVSRAQQACGNEDED